MKWDQKFAALKSLTPTHLEMRKPGDWYVEAFAREVTSGDGIYAGRYGNGATPICAVEADWELMTNLKNGEVIVIRHGSRDEKKVRWNGFMWEPVNV